jgi:hypothetical protein
LSKTGAFLLPEISFLPKELTVDVEIQAPIFRDEDKDEKCHWVLIAEPLPEDWVAKTTIDYDNLFHLNV